MSCRRGFVYVRKRILSHHAPAILLDYAWSDPRCTYWLPRAGHTRQLLPLQRHAFYTHNVKEIDLALMFPTIWHFLESIRNRVCVALTSQVSIRPHLYVAQQIIYHFATKCWKYKRQKLLIPSSVGLTLLYSKPVCNDLLGERAGHSVNSALNSTCIWIDILLTGYCLPIYSKTRSNFSGTFVSFICLVVFNSVEMKSILQITISSPRPNIPKNY